MHLIMIDVCNGVFLKFIRFFSPHLEDVSDEEWGDVSDSQLMGSLSEIDDQV